MITIKLAEKKDLQLTDTEPIYQGENIAENIEFLVPKAYGPIEDVATAFLYLTYIRPDGVADIIWLHDETEYNESYYKYTMDFNTKFTRVAGQICLWLQIYNGNPSWPTILKTNELMLNVQASKDVNMYLDDSNLSLVYEMQKTLADKDTELEESIDALDKKKADNMKLDVEKGTLQLLSGEDPVGDAIVVQELVGKQVQDAFISKNGNLFIMFADGTYKNLGKVVGSDGKVYVPHIDDHKILTFTIEDRATVAPDSTDLNPNDEWVNIEDVADKADFVWETIADPE